MTSAISLSPELAQFLRRTVFVNATDVEIEDLRRPSGGASWETFVCACRVTEANVSSIRRVVIRRAPTGGPMAPYLIDKDVAILQALHGSDVPVPELLAFTEDCDVFARPFIVTEFVEGDSHDVTKIERWSVWQRDRPALGRAIVDVAAALNHFEWRGTEIAAVMGSGQGAGDRLATMITRYLDPLLERSRLSDTPQPFCREIASWLQANVPELDEGALALVHGDFRFGNFLWQDTRLAAVLDWERAMLGDPMANLGFFCMPLTRRIEPALMGKAIRFDDAVARYTATSGSSVDRLRVHFYMIFWQFLEAVNSARGSVDMQLDGGPVSSSGLLLMNVIERQTLELVERFDRGDHDVFAS